MDALSFPHFSVPHCPTVLPGATFSSLPFPFSHLQLPVFIRMSFHGADKLQCCQSTLNGPGVSSV